MTLFFFSGISFYLFPVPSIQPYRHRHFYQYHISAQFAFILSFCYNIPINGREVYLMLQLSAEQLNTLYKDALVIIAASLQE